MSFVFVTESSAGETTVGESTETERPDKEESRKSERSPDPDQIPKGFSAEERLERSDAS